MSGNNSGLSRRRLLQGAGAMWLMSVSPVGLAAAARVVAVRVWPASTYTRVTVESNHVLKYRQFALSNPERVVVDLEGVNLNSVLKGMGGQIRAVPGAVLGWDMTAALAMASAMGISPRAVVELLPVIEAVMVRKLNEEARSATGPLASASS